MKLEQQVCSLEHAKRLCPRCKTEKSVSDFYERRNWRWPSERYQSYCKACVRERTHEFYVANRDRLTLRERQRKASLGPVFLEKRREQRAKVRREVIEAYGGKCACCGESEAAFLAIDHIDGGGKAHLASIGGASSLIYWLRKNGYPEGFQVLCHNCNMAKGIYKICPHQHEIGGTSM